MNEKLIAAAVALFGDSEIRMFERLLKAAESKNTVAEVVATAIRSKIKAETERLSGKVLTRMERNGTPLEVQRKVKIALGIGGSRIEDDYSDILSETKTSAAAAN